jgi:hypothetical protein
MTNHPHRGRSYWYKSPSSLATDYIIGIATTAIHAKWYAHEGFARIDRERARRELSNTGDGIYCTVMIDGEAAALTRFELARGMKTGRLAAA